MLCALVRHPHHLHARPRLRPQQGLAWASARTLMASAT